MRSIQDRSIQDLAGSPDSALSERARSSAVAGARARQVHVLVTKSARRGGLNCEGHRHALGARLRCFSLIHNRLAEILSRESPPEIPFWRQWIIQSGGLASTLRPDRDRLWKAAWRTAPFSVALCSNCLRTLRCRKRASSIPSLSCLHPYSAAICDVTPRIAFVSRNSAKAWSPHSRPLPEVL